MMLSPSLVPPLPRTQALTSKTFKIPPVDGSLTIPELFNWQSLNSPKHPLFAYADENSVVRTINWFAATNAMHAAARLMRQQMGCHPEECPSYSGEKPVIAIISSSDTITYFTLTVGIQYAGYAVFLVSPRNSPEAIAYLLAATKTRHVLSGREPVFHDLVQATMNILKEKYPLAQRPSIAPIPIFEDIFTAQARKPPPYRTPAYDELQIILHSSGSTAMPKVVPWTRRLLSYMLIVPYFGDQDLTGKRLACHSLPMYHGMGMVQTAWTASSGVIITTFKPSSPAIQPTPDSVFRSAIDSESDIIFCVPTFVELWARNIEYVKRLSKGISILYGGGPLNKEAGDIMTAKGVPVFILYGCSETGPVSPIIPNAPGFDWEYFRIAPCMRPHFIPDEDRRAELVLVSNDYNVPSVLNTTVDGVPAYATSDLLEQHPTKPGYWKVFGRKDDQIMHSTGEKTNPGPLENIMNQDPHVLSSVMVGRGRFQTAILIDPRPVFKFDPTEVDKLTEFRNKIWPTVERMNIYAPQHSRIFKEMILVASPFKPFTYTAKNTVRRQAVIEHYEPEIDALFATVDETAQTDIAPPDVWDEEQTLLFVRKIVNNVLKKTISDSDDIFLHGGDSLQATWIRNSLRYALWTSAQVETRSMPSSFVYQNPTITTLAAFIFAHAKGINTEHSQSATVEDMKAMVTKYTQNIPRHSGSIVTSANNDVVLLTGTTGALGVNILAQLVQLGGISRVYALNRRAIGKTLRERQEAALITQGINVDILDSEKVVLIEGDISKSGLGIDEQLYQEMERSITHVMHNAWRVDFNLSLNSFEANVRGLRNLIDLALSSPMRSPPPLLFTSTVGVFRKPSPEMLPLMREKAIEPDVAIGTGYSESKWVAEEILRIVSSKTPLQSVVIRVGQLSGGINGAWNTAEWVPAMIKSSVHIGALPDSAGSVSWIPLHQAAQAIVEVRNTDQTVLHLSHPNPTAWSELFTVMSRALNLPLETYARWLEKLSRSHSDAETAVNGNPALLNYQCNPALRILGFFQSLDDISEEPAPVGSEALRFPSLSIENAVHASRTLSALPKLGEEDVRRWLQYWKSIGYLAC